MSTSAFDTSEPGLVPAVFAQRAEADAAIAALRDLGVADSDIGVAVPLQRRHQHREPSDREVFEVAGGSAAKGASLGSIGGIGVLALTGGGVLALGVGGLLAVGMGGLVWGGIIGGLLGVITRVRREPQRDRWCEVPLTEGDVLVIARVHSWTLEDKIATVMKQHGARCVLDQFGLDKSWHELELEHPSGQAVAPS
jgi:hypothetical protein